MHYLFVILLTLKCWKEEPYFYRYHWFVVVVWWTWNLVNRGKCEGDSGLGLEEIRLTNSHVMWVIFASCVLWKILHGVLYQWSVQLKLFFIHVSWYGFLGNIQFNYENRIGILSGLDITQTHTGSSENFISEMVFCPGMKLY